MAISLIIVNFVGKFLWKNNTIAIMKKGLGFFVAIAMTFGLISSDALAEKLVILTTNDTHSQIDPTADNRGGILRRKVIVDSVRGAEKNVLLIDAGDAVQGTLYFTLFKGKVEFAMLDSLKYDAYILGNHEFDNGMSIIADFYRNMKTERLSANYELKGTPLDGLFKPYVIKEYAGKRIGIMGINLLPKGMIADEKCEGVVYKNSSEIANATAAYLKNVEKADFVIMISHVGYRGGNAENPSDVQIVGASKDIDLVIGGHSHTTIDPSNPKSVPCYVKNAAGREVLVTQTGAQGRNVGYITLDLDAMKLNDYKLIKVDKRYDDRANYPELAAFLAPYREKVDSLMNCPLTHSARALEKYEPAMYNFVGDAAYNMASELSGMDLDLAIMNGGGIRQPMPKGVVTEGLIRSMFPFENKVVVLKMTGQQLLDAFTVMAGRGGDPVSNQVRVYYTKMDGGVKVVKATVNGKKLNPNATYIVGTIDYLANGGDYMVPMTKCPQIFVDNENFGDRMLAYLSAEKAKGVKIAPSGEHRMKRVDGNRKK